MIKLIQENFNLHAITIPGQTPGMKVMQTENLTYVDSGLSCDTFNILHILNGKRLTELELHDALQYYRVRKLAYCIWITEENLSSNVKRIFQLLSLQEQNREPGMILNLSLYQPEKISAGNIKKVQSLQQLEAYATSIASNWTPPDQNVIEYYKRTATNILNTENNIILLGYFEDDKPVSVLEMFPSDNKTLGLYGLATLASYRGKGIGTALMRHALALAKDLGYTHVILQASEDGIGIYQKLGFRRYTVYYEFV